MILVMHQPHTDCPPVADGTSHIVIRQLEPFVAVCLQVGDGRWHEPVIIRRPGDHGLQLRPLHVVLGHR